MNSGNLNLCNDTKQQPINFVGIFLLDMYISMIIETTFLREFQPMVSAPDDCSLSSDQ